MKKNTFKIIGIASTFLFVLFICGLAYAYYLLYTDSGPNLPPNITYLSNTGSSKIDPRTILHSLDRGDIGVFQLESGIPEKMQFITTVEWKQAEFFEVGTALYQAVWKESLDEWSLYRVNFFTECKNNPRGFSEAEFYFYKVVAEKMFSVRAILIVPEYGYVAWGDDNDWPRPLFAWKTIDLNKVAIPAEEALVLAETKGGKDFRTSAKNECQILINMNPQIYGRNEWQVMYGGDNVFWIPSK